jgi:carboxypeptidase Q
MRHASAVCILFVLFSTGLAQAPSDKVDSLTVARFKEEGIQNSQVMEILSTLSDRYGPRLAWSPEFKRAAEWVSRQLKSWGLQNVHYDYWAPLGKGWSLKNFSAMVVSPVTYPVIAYPAAWSPGIHEKEADAIFLDVKKPEDFQKYRGKLKGKFVLLSEPVPIWAHFAPEATRLEDSVLLRMANADLQSGARRFRRRMNFARLRSLPLDSAFVLARQFFPDLDSSALTQRIQEMQVGPRKLEFAEKEGALAAITAGRGDDGTLLVQSAAVPPPPDGSPAQRINAYDPGAPEIIPQVVFAAEHYNRLIRLLEKGEKVKLEMNLEVATTKADSGFNIIGEIPGTDLQDEIVMIGGHFDSWHSGTGATDNGTGTGACMEAVRILETLAQKYGMKTRRTIRIGLWGAEEEGLIGSREYVSQTFAKREGGPSAGFLRGGGELTKMPDYDKFSVYLNHDNGTGRIRGIYLQGNEDARPIFRSWFTAFGDPLAQTITIQNTGGTDHQSFDGVGLPGFQFIQDPIDYNLRTHHYNMDVYDRIQEEDMKQAATIMAFFAYEAANRDGRFPRKAVPSLGTR